jgi:hypothetical protein
MHEAGDHVQIASIQESFRQQSRYRLRDFPHKKRDSVFDKLAIGRSVLVREFRMFAVHDAQGCAGAL